jgi:hypothetical protein
LVQFSDVRLVPGLQEGDLCVVMSDCEMHLTLVGRLCVFRSGRMFFAQTGELVGWMSHADELSQRGDNRNLPDSCDPE